MTTSQHGLDNGMALIRRQAIILTNDGWITDAYMRHSLKLFHIMTSPCVREIHYV